MSWDDDFNFEKMKNFLQLFDSLKSKFTNPILEKIKKYLFISKAKILLESEYKKNILKYQK